MLLAQLPASEAIVERFISLLEEQFPGERSRTDAKQVEAEMIGKAGQVYHPSQL
jgi:hypothetical protein